jgi:hypothetical protein
MKGSTIFTPSANTMTTTSSSSLAKSEREKESEKEKKNFIDSYCEQYFTADSKRNKLSLVVFSFFFLFLFFLLILFCQAIIIE